MAVVKKYMLISNWADFPEVKGLQVIDGNLYRTFCHCGFTACETLKECPICGNTEFIRGNQTKSRYELMNLDDMIVKYHRYYYKIIKNGLTQTQISRQLNTEIVYVNNCHYHIDDILTDVPELKEVAPMKLAIALREHLYDINVMKRDSTSWYVHDHFRYIVKFCTAVYAQNKNVSLEEMCDWLQYCYGGDVLEKVRWVSNSKDIAQSFKGLRNVSPIVQVFAKDLAIWRLVCDKPTIYNKMDPVIGELIAAYYSEGYLENIQSLVDMVYDYSFDDNKRVMFTKYFKEMYANAGYKWSELKEMLDYMKENDFENAKDYFFQQNYQRLVNGYGEKKVHAILNDIYKHPANMLIQLVNS